MRRLFSSCGIAALVLFLGLAVGCGKEQEPSKKVAAYLEKYEKVVVEFEELAEKGPLTEAARKRLKEQQAELKAEAEALNKSEKWTQEDLERFGTLTGRLHQAVNPPEKKP